MSSPDYFTIDADWEVFASANVYPYLSDTSPQPWDPIQPLGLDIAEARAGQAEEDVEWVAAHPLKELGYVARLTKFQVRDGTEISVKISYPSEYRMVPEHPFPTWINDSWDVLENIFCQESKFTKLGIELDLRRVMLAGSSSGAGMTAVLSQMCSDHSLLISGVILNVPVLCDYCHFTARYRAKGQMSSYQQCVGIYCSGAMVWVWNSIHPSKISGADPKASPLLGDYGNLPPRLIFVAGQDALRNEGIVYAAKLKESGVPVELDVYGGVPHHFAHFSELKAIVRFQESLRVVLGRWLKPM